VDRPAEAIGNVRQVHQHRRRGAFFNLRVQAVAVTRLHSADEVGEVIAALLVRGARFLILAHPGLVLAIAIDGHVALGPVELVADRIRVFLGAALANAGFVVRHPVTHLEFHHAALTAIVELEGAVERVRRFLVVVEHEVAADRARLDREFYAQAPACDVDFMDALVA